MRLRNCVCSFVVCVTSFLPCWPVCRLVLLVLLKVGPVAVILDIACGMLVRWSGE